MFVILLTSILLPATFTRLSLKRTKQLLNSGQLESVASTKKPIKFFGTPETSLAKSTAKSRKDPAKKSSMTAGTMAQLATSEDLSPLLSSLGLKKKKSDVVKKAITIHPK